jgi:Response regulator receiver domain
VPGGKSEKFSRADQPSRILPSIPRPHGGSVRVHGLRVLIIDNDPAKLDVLSTDLRGLGATVGVGDQGDSGFNQAMRFMPDVVISDLVSPGETGWRFIERLRHHPLLHWTPILLLRWWETTASGDGRVLIDRLVDRVEEVLASRRVIEERIAAGQPLGERIELIGPPLLLRLLAGARLNGLLTVNDAWSVFEVRINGDQMQIRRNGVDGNSDNGIQALLQLLLCDVGRWTFRTSSSVATQKTGLSVDGSLKQAGHNLSLLFRQDALFDTAVVGRLRVEKDALLAAAATMEMSTRGITDAIIEGKSETELDVLASGNEKLMEVDRVIKILIRCGAIHLDEESPKGARRKNDSEQSIGYLLKKLSEQWTDSPLSDDNLGAAGLGSGQAVQRPNETKSFAGAYSVSNVASERIGQIRTAKPLLTQETIDLEHSDKGNPDAEDTSPVSLPRPDTTPFERPDGRILRELRDGGMDDFSGGFRRMIHDSLAPGPIDNSEKGRGPMVFALVLALLLGALLVAGVVLLADSDRRPSRPATGQSPRP